MNPGCRSILVRGLLLLVVALFPCLFVWGALYALQNFRGTCGTSLGLSSGDLERVAALGYDPQWVAAAAGAIPWCSGVFGRNVDIGILMSIPLSETGNGSTYGGYRDGLGQAAQFSWAQEAAAKLLLARFDRYNIRRSNPIAAQYVTAGYNNYKGHKAGEMGPGFLPTTWQQICVQYLQHDADREVQSCDPWNPKVFMRGIAAVIAKCGYDSGNSREKNFGALWCWNHLVDYRWDLLDWASFINQELGYISPVVSGKSAANLQWGLGPENDLGVFAYLILQPMGLFPPSGQVWLDAPFPEGYPREVTQGWMAKEQTDKEGHTGIDWDCVTGDPILAVGPGRVIQPKFNSLMGWLSDFSRSGTSGFGKTVWIEHPNGLYTIYAHLDSVAVENGQQVSAGQEIGTCGNTGASEGDHIHLGVSDVHPDEFHEYHQWGPGGWINPLTVLGQCAG